MHAQVASITGNEVFNLPLNKKRGHAYVTVTPAIAQRWLEFNTSNRAIVRMHLEAIMRQMRDGMWRDNGEAIRFAPGKLLDGQHRLAAIMEVGKEFLISVEYGLNPETQDTMDTGRHRTPRDILSIEGLAPWESRVLGSAIHTMMAVDEGGAIYSNKKFTNAEVKAYYLEHFPEIERSLEFIKTMPRKTNILPLAMACALHYLFSRKSERHADTFFEYLFIGDNLIKTSAVFHLRNRLVNDAIDGRKRGSYERMSFIIKAWNSVRGGRSMKSETSLHSRADAEFPEIH